MLRELEAARQYPEAEARGLLGREVYLKYSRRLPGINSTALVPAGTKAKIVGIKPNVVDTGGELDTTYQLIIRVDFPTGEHTLFDCDREIFNSLYSMSPLQPQASSS